MKALKSAYLCLNKHFLYMKLKLQPKILYHSYLTNIKKKKCVIETNFKTHIKFYDKTNNLNTKPKKIK